MAPEQQTPAEDWAANVGSGLEPPDAPWEPAQTAPLDRTFAFVDLSGFTAWTDRHGAHAAIDLLGVFRGACRRVAARRGVRIGKWLGDGCMIVGVDAGRTISAAGELVTAFARSELPVRAGVARGDVLLFEGDDYVGRAVNLASRLCDAARPGRILAGPRAAASAPAWLQLLDAEPLDLYGFGTVTDLVELKARAEG